MNTMESTADIANSHPHDSIDEIEDRFSCNICLESVKSPVVTRCGHLYCWSCLYIWLEPGMTTAERRYLDSSYVELTSRLVDSTRRMCPVCKSACDVKELVPIYVRECRKQQSNEVSDSEVNDKDKNEKEIEGDQLSDDIENEQGEDYVGDDSYVVLNENITTTATTAATTGLRRRRIQPSEVETSPPTTVPSRPLPPPSTIQETTTNRAQNNQFVATTQGRSSAEALHQSLFQALVAVQTNTPPLMTNLQQNQSSGSSIPSLHYRNRNGSNNISDSNDGGMMGEGQRRDAATEFLGHLMLFLGCFVFLCLLLF